jgi:alpha-tubulin suppressor-like RCC1 family protein/mono/diheme cytochrome c family protein
MSRGCANLVAFQVPPAELARTSTNNNKAGDNAGGGWRMRNSGSGQRRGTGRGWSLDAFARLRRLMRLAQSALLVLLALQATHAAAQQTSGSWSVGEQLWNTHCWSCHAVTRSDVRNAANAGGHIAYLAAVGKPFGSPAPNLSTQQYNDIAAYIAYYTANPTYLNSLVRYNATAATEFSIPNLKMFTTYGRLTDIFIETFPTKGTLTIVAPEGIDFRYFAYTPNPGASGRDQFTFYARRSSQNGFGSTTLRTVLLDIESPLAPSFSDGIEGNFLLGISGHFGLSVSGIPRPVVTIDGNLPPGIGRTLTESQSPYYGYVTDYLYSGAASTGSEGDYPLTVTASNGIGPPLTRNLTLRVRKRPNYITFFPPPQIVIGSSGVPLNATGGSSASVTYTTDNSTVCALAGSTVVPRLLGTCRITANQVGDDLYLAAAPAERTIEVIAQSQVVDFLPQAARVFKLNGTFDINPLAVASSGLAVTYDSLTPTRCSISGISVTMLSAGNCTIRASQAGTVRIAPAFADMTIPLNASAGGGQPRLVTPQLPRAVSGVPYSANLLLAGSLPVLSVTVSGLPPGLSAIHNGAGSIEISGTPSGDGSYGILIQAFSSAGAILNGATLEVLNAGNYAGNVVQVDGGGSYTCAVLSGGVQCWGYNLYGQLGDDSSSSSSVGRIAIPPGSGATRVSAGAEHACAVVAGGVMCWGNNTGGKLGDGTTTLQRSPVSVIPAGGGVTDVSAGVSHTCAVVAGGVSCWGANSFGELGLGDTMGRLTPTSVIPAGSGVTAVAVGNVFTCAVVSGGVRCWGNNASGQLGDGSAVAQSSTPVQAIAAGNGVDAIAAGNHHVCAVRNSGLQCWGSNFYGQLGDGGVNGLTNVPWQTVPAGSGVVSVSAGNFHTCFAASGGVKCFGYNLSGELGIASNVSANLPQTTIPADSDVSSVGVGSMHSCAVAAGYVRCWGSSSSGALGNVGLTGNWRVPIQVFAAGSGASAVATGSASTTVNCAAVDGGISCWGNAGYMLGNDSTAASITPVTAVASGSGASVVSIGNTHVCAVVNGAAKCWGGASKYQLGLQSGSPSGTPQQVFGLTSGVTDIVAGYEHSCAAVGGGVKCWGDHLFGQLGTGGFNPTLTPVDVVSAGAGTGHTKVAAGRAHSCALAGSNVRCWGDNVARQLGDGGTTRQLSPVSATDVGSGNVAIAAREALSCSVANGGVRCWGDGSSAFDVLVPGSNATAVSVGVDHYCVVVSGGVQCAGDNSFGQLGNGSNQYSSELVNAIPPGSGVTAVSAGRRQTCAVAGGGVVCWGEAAFGLLGTPTVYPYGKILPAAVQIMFAPQAINFAPLADRAATSAPFTVTATGGGSGNAVQFSSQTTSVCTASGLNGSTITLTGAVGTCTIVASQNGNADYLDAAQVTRSFTAGAPPQYTITPSAGTNGSISPSIAQSVTSGGAISFTLTPAGGFAASVVGSCNGTLVGNVYTIDPVLASCSVMASFTAIPAGVPSAPQNVFASPMAGAASIYFSPPASSGTSAISYYTATCQPGNVSFSNTSSPMLVQGLTDGQTYTCSVTATNASGTGPSSTASNSVVPGTTPSVPNLIGVVSRKTHATAGTFDLPVDSSIPIGGAVTIESRVIGAGHLLVFQFDAPVTAVSGVTAVNAAMVAVGAVSAVPTGSEIHVTLAGVADNSRVTVSVPLVNGGASSAAASLGFLVGDINNSRSVNASDISGIKARAGQAASSSNFKFDLNASGSINATDISAVKARAGLVLP